MLPLLRPISASISNDESDDPHAVGNAEAVGMTETPTAGATEADENAVSLNMAVLSDSDSEANADPAPAADTDADKGELAESAIIAAESPFRVMLPSAAVSDESGRNVAGASNGFLTGEFNTDDEAEEASEPRPEMCGDDGTDWLVLPVLPSDSYFLSSDFESDFDEMFRPNMPRRDFLRPPRNPGRSELLGLSTVALDASAEADTDVEDDDESAAVSIEKDSTASCDDVCGMARYSSPCS